jgi:excisionase family DNA binding protein
LRGLPDELGYQPRSLVHGHICSRSPTFGAPELFSGQREAESEGMRTMENNELERYFSIAETCRVLGIERSTLRSRIKAGRLAAVRLDGSIRVPRQALVDYIASATPVTA